MYYCNSRVFIYLLIIIIINIIFVQIQSVQIFLRLLCIIWLFWYMLIQWIKHINKAFFCTSGGVVDALGLQYRVQRRFCDLCQCVCEGCEAGAIRRRRGRPWCWCRQWWSVDHPHLQRTLVWEYVAPFTQSGAPKRLFLLSQDSGNPLAVHHQLTSAGRATAGLRHHHPYESAEEWLRQVRRDLKSHSHMQIWLIT